MDRRYTFESLSRNFEVSSSEIRRLALKCGIPIRPRGRYLTEEERDRLYDEWLASNVNDENLKASETKPENDKMIFIDTSSLLQPGAAIFLKNSAAEMLATGQKIIIPFVVITELNKKALQSDNAPLSKRARNMLKAILNYKEMGIIAIYGDENDGSFADNVFHKIATMFALRRELIFITQDYRLGQDLLMMLHMGSVRHRKISVYKLDAQGQLNLVNWKG